MSKVAQKEEYPIKTQNKVIVLKAVAGKQKGRFTCMPTPDGYGGYKGIIAYTEEQKRTYPTELTSVNAETAVNIEDMTRFDLNLLNHAAKWNYVQHDYRIAMSPSQLKEGDYDFVVYDEEEELDNKLSVKKQKYELERWVREMSASEQVKLCRYLGQKASLWKPAVIEDYLIDLARSDAYKSLQTAQKAFLAGTATTKLYLHELEDAGIVQKTQSGYKHMDKGAGVDILLGLDEAQALFFLENPENGIMVKKFQQLLLSKKA